MHVNGVFPLSCLITSCGMTSVRFAIDRLVTDLHGGMGWEGVLDIVEAIGGGKFPPLTDYRCPHLGIQGRLALCSKAWLPLGSVQVGAWLMSP
jgi:hypothetical protein